MTNMNEIYGYQRPNGGQQLHFRNNRYPNPFRNEELNDESLSDQENAMKNNMNNGSIRNSNVNYIYNRYVIGNKILSKTLKIFF